MSWLQLSFETKKPTVELYSEYLTTAGAVSVTFEDPQDKITMPLFEPLPGTTPLWDNTRIIGLFEATADIELIKRALQDLLDLETLKTLKIEPLADQNWNITWMDQFHPLRFGKNLWICPSFRDIPDPTATNILLDPGMAFGTGTHPTTRLCLEWLEANPPTGQLVLDYGCGSGILGIAALKLGAAFVYGVDHDPQALQSTAQNAKANGYNKSQISAIPPDLLKLPLKVDLIVANILANPLIELASTFANLIQTHGKVVLSGILESQIQTVVDHYQTWFTLKETAIIEGWARLQYSPLPSWERPTAQSDGG